MLQDIKELFGAITWQIAVIILTLLFRKNLVQFISALTDKIKKPGKLSISKDGLTIEEFIELKQNEIIEILTNLDWSILLNKIPKDIIENHTKSIKLSDAKYIESEDSKKLEDPIKYDPAWKDVLGPVGNKRQIFAKVTPTQSGKYFKLKISVASTDPSDPLVGKVKFFLHPSFVDPTPEVVAVNGIATLNLLSYGSFTFGVETDNGSRRLKMELAEDVPGVSDYFKNN